MKLKNASIDIIVKAPSLGLTTVIPTDQPATNSAVQAKNVRFDYGSARPAPGYDFFLTDIPLDSSVNLLVQTELVRNDGNVRSPIVGTKRKIYVAMRRPVPDRAPTVYAGPDQSISENYKANLLGTVFDPDIGDTYTVNWTTVSGPGTAAFHNQDLVSTLVDVEAFGTYVFRLTATDASGLSGYDDVAITFALVESSTVDGFTLEITFEEE